VKLATDVLMAFVASEQVDARNFSVTVTTDDAGETVAQLTPTDAATEAETQEASALAQNVEGIDSVQVDGEPAPHMEDEASEEAQEAVAAANEDTPRPTQDAGSTEFEEMEEAVEVGTPADVEAPELDEEEETSEEEEEVEPSEPEAEEDYRMYTIKRGDTLSIISARELGDGSRWTEIYELNRDIIGPNPDGIRDGMEIRLPEPAEE
jgi:nucleoid-associated protein YgaU